jgi:hypothetical protein
LQEGASRILHLQLLFGVAREIFLLVLWALYIRGYEGPVVWARLSETKYRNAKPASRDKLLGLMLNLAH